MNCLYWVRHGESTVNLTRKFSYRLVSHAHLSGEPAEIVPGLPKAGDFESEG